MSEAEKDALRRTKKESWVVKVEPSTLMYVYEAKKTHEMLTEKLSAIFLRGNKRERVVIIGAELHGI